MPPKTKPVTYNQHVAKVIDGLMGERGMTREEVAHAAGLSFATFERNMRGATQAGWTASQLERIAAALGSNPGYIMDRALNNYGGIDKLLSEVRAKNVTPDDDAGVLDNVTQLSQRESKGVDQERQAALRGKEETEQ